MALSVAAAVFMMLLTLISAYGYRLYVKPVRFQERLGSAVTTVIERIGEPEQQWVVRIVQQVGERVMSFSPQDATLSRRMLIAAGFRSDAALKVYYGTKIILTVLFLALALIFRGHIQNLVGSWVVVLAAGFAGWFGPQLFVDRLVGRRQEKLRFALPDALDLMVVCMEAGLALDQAIANVSRELATTHKEISEELGLVTLEMRAGKRRNESLKNLGERTGEPNLKKLVATMIQSDRFGTSIAESLRTHSDYLRVRRRQEAEERAAKVGVKLVFPIFFCILPSMLVVAAGPGILGIVKHLFPAMNG